MSFSCVALSRLQCKRSSILLFNLNSNYSSELPLLLPPLGSCYLTRIDLHWESQGKLFIFILPQGTDGRRSRPHWSSSSIIENNFGLPFFLLIASGLLLFIHILERVLRVLCLGSIIIFGDLNAHSPRVQQSSGLSDLSDCLVYPTLVIYPKLYTEFLNPFYILNLNLKNLYFSLWIHHPVSHSIRAVIIKIPNNKHVLLIVNSRFDVCYLICCVFT